MRGRKKKNIIDRSSMKDFNTIRETAFITGLSEKYLRRLQKEDKLPGGIQWHPLSGELRRTDKDLEPT